MQPEKKKRRQIEREFGVPIAGEILDAALWTNTALKHLPSEGQLDLPAVFSRDAPLVIDLGCGNGRFLLGSAVWRPTLNHLGVDILPLVIRYATRRGNQRALTNLRFAVVDGLQLLARYIPSGSACEIHCYHPQPYYDPLQVDRRLVTPEFLAQVHRTLAPGGQLFIQTDNPGYWSYIREIVPVFFDFHERIGRWPDAPKGRTRREIIALRRNLPIFRGTGVRKESLSEEQALATAAELPPPVFNAERYLRELDDIERRPS